MSKKSDFATNNTSLHIYSEVFDQRTAADGASEISFYVPRPSRHHAPNTTCDLTSDQLSILNETYTISKRETSVISSNFISDDDCSSMASSISIAIGNVDTTLLNSSGDTIDTNSSSETSSISPVSELEHDISSLWLDEDEASRLKQRCDTMSSLLLAERRFIDAMNERKTTITRPVSNIITSQQHELLFKGLDNLCMMSELLLDEVAFMYDKLPNQGKDYDDNGLELQVYSEHVRLIFSI